MVCFYDNKKTNFVKNKLIIMKKITPCIIILFFGLNSFSQQTSSNNGEITILLSANVENTTISYYEKIRVLNDNNVVLSGLIESDESIIFTPNNINYILITPATEATFGRDSQGNQENGTSTVIGSKKTSGIGRHVSLQSNPVQNNLIFSISEGLASSYSIYDLSGNLLSTQNIAPTSTSTIDVTNLNIGNYLLKIDFDNAEFTTIYFIKN